MEEELVDFEGCKEEFYQKSIIVTKDTTMKTYFSRGFCGGF
jgi:hypothetical protein